VLGLSTWLDKGGRSERDKQDRRSLVNYAYNTSELRRSTAVVYHSDRQTLSTARYSRAGQLATADIRHNRR